MSSNPVSTGPQARRMVVQETDDDSIPGRLRTALGLKTFNGS